MEATADLVATAAYQPERQAAAAARQFVRDVLRSWQLSGAYPGQDEIIDDAVLLTSELVTNAVLHARTTVQVACRCVGGAVEVAVVDYSPAPLAPSRPAEAAAAERTGGRGLALPPVLASAWGVTYTPTRKAVWFRLGGADMTASWLADEITGAAPASPPASSGAVTPVPAATGTGPAAGWPGAGCPAAAAVLPVPEQPAPGARPAAPARW